MLLTAQYSAVVVYILHYKIVTMRETSRKLPFLKVSLEFFAKNYKEYTQRNMRNIGNGLEFSLKP